MPQYVYVISEEVHCIRVAFDLISTYQYSPDDCKSDMPHLSSKSIHDLFMTKEEML